MKRSAFWTAVLVLPLLMGAASFGLYHASNSASQVTLADCCLEPSCPPGCCDQCPPDCVLTVESKIICPDSQCCADCPPCPWCP
jgi:hypothetical protein